MESLDRNPNLRAAQMRVAGARMSSLPPGPDRSALLQTLAYHRDPLGVLRRVRGRHGPVFTLRQSLKGPLVIVADLESVDGRAFRP